MSIWIAVSKETYDAHTEGKREYDDSYGKHEYLIEKCKGRVLWLGERNFYDDSDFFAMVWDPETKTAKKVQYATTRAWTYNNSAHPDALPEYVEAYQAWRKALQDAYEARKAAERLALEEKKAKDAARVGGEKERLEVLRGKRVIVKYKGQLATGTLSWMRASASGKTLRVGVDGIEGAGGRVFMPSSCVNGLA